MEKRLFDICDKESDNYEIVSKELTRVKKILWELDEDVTRLKHRTGFGKAASYDELEDIENRIIDALGTR